MIGPERCGGVVTTNADGKFIERGACEVHLFSPPGCAWQRKTHEERDARRKEET